MTSGTVLGMSFDEVVAMPGLHAEADVAYIPLPNIVDIVFTDRLAADVLTPTAFVFPFLDDGRVVLATNRRRGLEVPGGHRDQLPDGQGLETPEETAAREAFEEAGAVVADLVPIGFLRARTTAAKPEGYRYPHPLSCQQFYAGRVTAMHDYVENDECLAPEALTPEDAEKRLRGRALELYRRAYRTMFPVPMPAATM